jgi:hypothetical protein
MAIQRNLDFSIRTLTQATVALLFVVAMLGNTDCHAQQRRGLFRRSARIQHQAAPQATRTTEGQFENREATPFRRFPAASRYFDPANMQSWDPGSGNQRYIGGFHYTHFQNIGIPSGDIGLRGNAYHWRPW